MAKEFEITDIVRGIRFKKTGEAYDVYEVHFVTKSGISDTVEIPVEEYYPENVEKIVKDVVAKHEAVKKL